MRKQLKTKEIIQIFGCYIIIMYLCIINLIYIETNNMIQLSIIIPVYNVEKYIRTCIESIFRQGLNEDDFEVIIVNDGSKDRSVEVIQDLIKLHENTIIMNQENQGSSVARNNGIAAAKGEYILMPDPDDLLIENSLKPLLQKALETKVDLVVADYLEMRNDDIVSLKTHPIQRSINIPSIEKTGEKLFLEDMNPHQSYIWRILFRKDFLKQQHIVFIPGIFVQDKPFIYESYIKAQKCLRISWPIYIYRKHSESVSYSMSEKYAKDYCFVISKLWEFTSLPLLSTKQKQRMIDYTFKTVLTLMRRLVHEMKDKCKGAEIIVYLTQVAPHLKFQQSLKQRIHLYLLKEVPHTYFNVFYIYITIYEDKIYPFIKHHFTRYLS